MGALGHWPLQVSTGTRRPGILILILIFTAILLTILTGRRIYSSDETSAVPFSQLSCPIPIPAASTLSPPQQQPHGDDQTATVRVDKTLSSPVETIEHTAMYYDLYKLKEPFDQHFGERGQRAVAIRKWIEIADSLPTSDEKVRIEQAVEKGITATFPYLSNPPNGSPTPFKSLRESYITDGNQRGSRGIVVPVGKKNLRMACQLVASVTRVHKSSLPIELAYAGDEDLGPEERDLVKELFPEEDVSFLNVISVFNDSTLALGTGGWAIKPFALLASRFGEVILADADTVFVQKPEAIFRQNGYKRKGALMFHDRLIDKERYMSRHTWWREQVVHPSSEVSKSLSWTENYAEEADSGIVVVNKGRLDVLMGMLHAGWQNSKDVREKVTYKVTYGDKESYWFGLELTEGPYEFEKHYGGIAGWMGTREGPAKVKDPQVCSYVIAHPDDEEKGLLWYNGSLLKNKINADREYLVPSHWMINGTWDKGLRPHFSCMKGGKLFEISEKEKMVLEKSVEEAKGLDTVFDGNDSKMKKGS